MKTYWCEYCEKDHKEYSSVCERCNINQTCSTVINYSLNEFGIQDVCKSCLKENEKGGFYKYHSCPPKGYKGFQGIRL